MSNKKVIDCFLFYNEVKMLEFRLKEHYNYVDHFVIVESNKSFTGKDKKYFFQENIHRYKEYLDKIIYVKLNDNAQYQSAWDAEEFQRNCISRGFDKLTLQDDDIILISDVDEILNVDIIPDLKSQDNLVLHSLEYDMYYYNMECYKPNAGWRFPKVISYFNFRTNPNCHKLRLENTNFTKKAGWHFSYFGDPKSISDKLSNFSHQEYNIPSINDIKLIEKQILEKKDLFGRDHAKITPIKIENNKFLPKNYKFLN
tara:strand:+ start:1040 stop:1807 length:768 start_codon:yes stop_codon:yes gene_type:complete